MIKAVLDTNVLISSLFWNGTPARIVQKGLEGKFTPITSAEIISEAEEVLSRKFKFPEQDIFEFHEIIVGRFEIVAPQIRIPAAVPRDPSDNKIIECAVAGNANFIVSGDLDVLDLKTYRDIKIVTSAQFLKILS